MTIVTTLVIPPGGDVGPFNLYSNSDGYTVPFATNVSAAALQAGYSSTVPNDATIIRVISTGLCTNFINLSINLLTTTTTTSSSTSTSTSSSTTTTTTTCPCAYINVTITEGYIAFSDTASVDVIYTNCNGFPDYTTYTVAGTYTICSSNINSIQGSYLRFGIPQTVPVFPVNSGTLCCIPTTSTTSSSSSTTTTSSSSTTTTTSSSSSSTTTTTTTCPNCTPQDVTIGSQIWTGCNLNVTTYRNGNTIPQVTDPTLWAGLTTGAWCYYNNDPSTEPIYGKLYNWHAVNDPRGLAPSGYHIPSQAEWDTLTTFLGGEFVAGGKMKSTGLCYWKIPNTAATNSSGFSALPGGIRTSSGVFVYIKEVGWWWTSSNYGLSSAWSRTIGYNQPSIGVNTSSRKTGYSIRLIKD